MKDYIVYIEKIQTSFLTVPARNKKEALKRTERLIDDINVEKIDIDNLISWNPEYKIKIKKSSTTKGAFLMKGK